MSGCPDINIFMQNSKLLSIIGKAISNVNKHENFIQTFYSAVSIRKQSTE